ncbi:MAG: GNAT family N-acetyltransferase [Planctomycetes bacterium]|nr:GNAT family N-acetyltransferase [Planctomycetota bacterium]
MPWHVEPFDPKCEDEARWKAVHDLSTTIGLEKMPDDPPVSLADTKRFMRTRTAHEDMRFWMLSEDGTPGFAATAHTYFEDIKENRHLLRAGIGVRREHRRRGMARRLLREIAGVAHETGRTLVFFQSLNSVPAAAAVLERLGAERGLVMHINQLVLSEVDRALLRDWQNRARERAAGFELVCWDGPYPEEDLQAVCDLAAVMNTAPRDKLKMEDWKITPAQMREYERVRAERKVERTVLAARETASGALAGLTVLYWDPAEPHLYFQGDTGVWPKYRNLGLGRWLKAAMLDRVLDDGARHPEAKFIRTGNAGSNAPMLKINHELGFRLYRESATWQIGIEKIDAYLEKTGKS